MRIYSHDDPTPECEFVAPSDLGQSVKVFKARSAHKVNRLLGRAGRVWQPAFYDHGVRRDEDVVAIARYIVANPVRAGLVARIGLYPFRDAVWL